MPPLPRRAAAPPWPAGAALLLLALAGCIDPIDLDVGAPDRRVVVNAELREGAGPHEVALRRSGAFTQGVDAIRPAERGARVSVLTDGGGEVVFREASPGVYVTGFGALDARPGEAYTLRVELADGTVYRSTPETMLDAPALLDVRARIVPGAVLTSAGTLVEDPRMEFRVDAARAEGRPNFYRWAWSGVYSRQACYTVANPFPETFCDRCYFATRGTSLVEIGDDARTSSEVLLDQGAGAVRLAQEGFLFDPALSVTFEQQALTPEAHAFWSRVRAVREAVGSLFDPPAEDVVGNIVNEADPRDFALGYFTVAGVSTGAGCIRREDFPEFPQLPGRGTVSGRCGVTVPGSLTPPPQYVAGCGRA